VNRADFYKTVSLRLGPLSQSQVDGIETLLDAIDGQPLSWQAYMLATAWHETAQTMQPIKERGGDAYFTRLYDVAGDRPKTCIAYGNTCAGDGPKYCGRGYVMLTWKANYARADRELAQAGIIKVCDLIANPDLAMRPDIAAFIMVRGMVEGWFSGKKLADYLPAQGVATKPQYVQARRIINILDKANLIEGYAQAFERALRDGGVA
jgi:putative chitinase